MDQVTAGLLPQSVAEICPGIHSVAGMIPLAGRRLSWIADDSTGFLPLHVYVLRDEKVALIVDSGVGAHRALLADGLGALLDGHADRRYLVTRREPDCFVNFSWIVTTFGITRFYYAGELNPINLFERFDVAADEMQLRHLYKGAIDNIQPGNSFIIGSRRIRMLKAPIRLIAAIFALDESSGTLFTSDSWGFVTRPSAMSSQVVTPSDDEISVDRIFGYLDKKFDWLRGLDPSSFKADLRALFEEHRIERICPSYGAVIEGRPAVERIYRRTLVALDRIAALRPRSAMDGFSWAPRR